MTIYIAIACGLLVFSLITLSFSSYGMRYDLVRRRVDSVLTNTQKADIIDEELSKPLSERIIKPFIKSMSVRLEKFMPKPSEAKSNAKRQQSEKLKLMLRQAGYNVSPVEYSVIRLFVVSGSALFLGMLTLLTGYGKGAILGTVFGLYAGYTIMRFHLTANISKRRRSMEEQLPNVLDLLSINVEAGLGFEQALLHVIGHFEGALIDELTITYREMTMGRTRRDALTLFAKRCELGEVKTFVGALIQAEQLGISIKNVLHAQAAAMRTSRRNKVEEKAMKISVKILLPMVGFIFPVLFIVLMGPAAVKIINQFRG